jgi:prepilin-type N-terminal cleavage/methylation domain-containing protein
MKKTCKNTAGFTLVELMIAMVLLAALMAAVAVAFNASIKNYHDNEAISKTINTARAALLRITNDLRTAESVAIIGVGGDPDNTQCSLVTRTGQNLTYRFEAAANTLWLDDNDSGDSYVLCRNITAMAFNRATVPSQPILIRNVRITMTVTDEQGDNPQTLAAAAVIRRNL